MKTSWKKAVANKIRNGLALYFNNVYNRQSQLSRWEQVKQSRQLPEINQLLANKPELFREDEINYYYEQKKITRIGYLSNEIDLDYEEMVENRQKENQFWNKEDEKVDQLCEDINLEVFNSDIQTNLQPPSKVPKRSNHLFAIFALICIQVILMLIHLFANCLNSYPTFLCWYTTLWWYTSTSSFNFFCEGLAYFS